MNLMQQYRLYVMIRARTTKFHTTFYDD